MSEFKEKLGSMVMVARAVDNTTLGTPFVLRFLLGLKMFRHRFF